MPFFVKIFFLPPPLLARPRPFSFAVVSFNIQLGKMVEVRMCANVCECEDGSSMTNKRVRKSIGQKDKGGLLLHLLFFLFLLFAGARHAVGLRAALAVLPEP